MIIRAPRPTQNWTQLDNRTLRDNRLSYRALGILVHVLSQPDNWSISSERLSASRKEGRDAIRAALNELESCKYLKREKERQPDGTIVSKSFVFDRPTGTGDGFLGDGDDQDLLPITPGGTGDGLPVDGFLGGNRSTTNNDYKKRVNPKKETATLQPTDYSDQPPLPPQAPKESLLEGLRQAREVLEPTEASQALEA